MARRTRPEVLEGATFSNTWYSDLSLLKEQYVPFGAKEALNASSTRACCVVFNKEFVPQDIILPLETAYYLPGIGKTMLVEPMLSGLSLALRTPLPIKRQLFGTFKWH